MKKNINIQVEGINDVLEWGRKYNSAALQSFERFKTSRRRMAKIAYALEENCSAAVYGESQVGKSYVVSSLLSSPDKPFMVAFGDKQYSFLNDLNPSGGAVTTKETTGIITRFTLGGGEGKMADYVKIKTLSVLDIVLLLTDAYYKDVTIESDEGFNDSFIAGQLGEIRSRYGSSSPVQQWITEDDIMDIQEYLKKNIGYIASRITDSDFSNSIAGCIRNIPPEKWVDVFSLLWHRNENMSTLFSRLIEYYGRLNFAGEVYVPYEALLRKNGTLLNIAWIDGIFGETPVGLAEYGQVTDVYDREGNVIARQYPKSFMSALIAELTLVVPQETGCSGGRTFLRHMDLLDFPGLRRRETNEEGSISNEMGVLLRRGKVSYLFNKYSSSLLVNTLLFCQDNKQNNQSEMGKLLDKWVTENIGKDEAERAAYIKDAGGVSPLFIVATKFNIDLRYINQKKEDGERVLKERWTGRFADILEKEVVKSSQYRWFNHWVIDNGISKPFDNLFLIRDYEHSKADNLFRGYLAGQSMEKEEVTPPEYPGFRADLKKTFLESDFVRKHFADPQAAWDGAATLNNDGSGLIIDALNRIAPSIDRARKEKYRRELEKITADFLSVVGNYYESDDPKKKIDDVKRIAGTFLRRIDSKFRVDTAVFGKMIKALMVDPVEIKAIVHRIINNYSDTTQEVGANFIWGRADIKAHHTREEKMQRLSDTYMTDWETLEKEFREEGVNIDELLGGGDEVLSTRAAVVVSQIMKYWDNFLSTQAVTELGSLVEGSDFIIQDLRSMFEKLRVKDQLLQLTDEYLKGFPASFSPTIIADAVALIINNFSSSFGSLFMKAGDRAEICEKAQLHGFKIDGSFSEKCEPGTVEEVITALDKAGEIRSRANWSQEDIAVLRKLPLYDNYWRWNDLLLKGRILASEMPKTDPTANRALHCIIEKVEQITYN